MYRFLATTGLLFFALTNIAFAQVNSAINGTAEDPSKALIPGVSVTAVHTATGVENRTVTNEAGVYNFPSLLPGNYKVSASLPGFKTHTYTDVELTQGNPLRLNFVLQVGQISSQVDVVVGADSILAAQGASVGQVLQEQRIRDLPIISNDVLDLARILPGFRESPGGTTLDTFAGAASSTVNVTRDGVSVNDGRYPIGTSSVTQMNPDLVGEIRLILTPVDAELGRGNAQIQVTTRSGTNRYSGSAVWNVRNSALDANTWTRNSTGGLAPWFNTHQVTVSYGGPIVKNKTFFFALWDQRMTRERTEVTAPVLTETARMGVYRYFDNWNPAYADRTPTPASTGTPSLTRVMPSVDLSGSPKLPLYNPQLVAGLPVPYSGKGLICFSVFGNSVVDPASGAMRPFDEADCRAGGLPVTLLRPVSSSTAPWDPARPVIDTTGFIFKNLVNIMPLPNYFGGTGTAATGPDGLNTANFRWLRGGAAGAGSIQSSSTDDNLKQINLKVDHVFNGNHKINGSWTYEWNNATVALPLWPGGVGGENQGRPIVLAVNMASTLSPSMLNEARFGMRYNKRNELLATDTPAGRSAGIQDLLLTSGPDPGITRAAGQTAPVYFRPGTSGGAYDYGNGNWLFDAGGNSFGSVSTLYSFADTVSWSKGTHSFRFGGEYRPTSSKGYGVPAPYIAAIGPSSSETAGVIVNPSPLTGGSGGDYAAFSSAGLVTLARTRFNASQLLYALAGNVESVSMNYWIENFKDVDEGKWQSAITQPNPDRTVISHEASGFFKDDWKATRNLTLNLGLRWEYYGPLYIDEGLTTTPIDRGAGLFGMSRSLTSGLFDAWTVPGGSRPVFLTGYGNAATAGANPLACVTGTAQNPNLPAATCDPSTLTQFEFVGPNSNNPGKTTQKVDWNNFGPAIGFSYQIPWLKRTTLRGGYSIQYGGAGRSLATGGGATTIFGATPGQSSAVSGTAAFADQFPGVQSLANMATITPIRPVSPIVPGVSSPLPIYTRSAEVTAYDNSYATPYTQNFNLSVTTNLTQKLTLDVRYVGTQSKKLQADIDLNTNNIYYNNELVEALKITRAGGDSPLLTDMFAGLNLNVGATPAPNGSTYTTIGTRNSAGIYQTGSMHLRRNTTFRQSLQDGNFLALAQALQSFALSTATTGATAAGYAGIPIIGGTAPAGRLLRNGCDRIANTGSGTFGVADDNGRIAQLVCLPENFLIANPQLSAANYRTNSASGNYHSMEAQLTLRPTHGLSVQTTYTWAKNMVTPGSGVKDLRDRRADYARNYASVASELRTNGTIELPIGPNRLLFGNTAGWVARLIEGWQTSFILNLATGSPRSILAGPGFNYGNTSILTGVTSGANITPDVVGPWNARKGKVVWDSELNRGTYLTGFHQFPDPQCAISNVTDQMGWNLGNPAISTVNCGLQAIAAVVDPSDPGAVVVTNPDGSTQTIRYLLVNPQPGSRGTLGQKTLESAGVFRFDANVQKRFQISESKSLQIRMDANNILNHPTAGSGAQPGTPTSNTINSDNFMDFTGKTGNRTFRASMRLNF